MIYDDFKITLYNLDSQWAQQPQLSFEYEEHLGQAKAEVERAKNRMDMALADAMDAIMMEPEDYNITRAQLNSSTFVKMKAIKDPAYQAAFEEWVKAKAEADRMQGAVWSMIDRRTALENLTRLYLADYFTTETALPDAKVEAIDEKGFRDHQKSSLGASQRMIRRVRDGSKNQKS